MAEEELKKQSNKMLIITGMALLVITIGLMTNGFGLFGPSSPVITGSAISNPELLSIGSSPVLGDENAQITMYVFSDFSCPYCAAAAGFNQEAISYLKSSNPNWQAPIPNIIKDYVNNGKVKIVFKYFPGHGTAQAAHKVGFALNEQNLFWEFHDLAFQNQADTNDREKMKSLAQELSADMPKLNAYLDANKADAQIKEDIQLGKDLGLKGTPAFIINNRLISGAQSYSEFKKIIDSQL